MLNKSLLQAKIWQSFFTCFKKLQIHLLKEKTPIKIS
jgi:hypothetical protein